MLPKCSLTVRTSTSNNAAISFWVSQTVSFSTRTSMPSSPACRVKMRNSVVLLRILVDEFAEAVFVEVGAAVVFVERAFEAGVVAFEGDHGVVHVLADAGPLGTSLELRPAGVLGHPENIRCEVFVFVLGIGAFEVACLCVAGRQALAILQLRGCSSKVSEMYLRKMRPRTTCLYSAASMLLRSLSAASHSLASHLATNQERAASSFMTAGSHGLL